MIQRAYNIFFETLGNKNRLMILEKLQKKPRTVNELSNELNLDQTTISHNLKRLYVTGFASFKIKGKNRIYFINSKIVNPLLKLVNYHIRCNCRELCKCNKIELKTRLKR